MLVLVEVIDWLWFVLLAIALGVVIGVVASWLTIN
jgi:hypothetical protein